MNKKKTLLAIGLLALGFSSNPQAAPAASPFAISLSPIGTYASGIFDASAAEIVAHDPVTQRLFVVNSASGLVDVLDIRDPASPALLFNIDLSTYGAAVNSVDVQQGLVVAVVQSQLRTDPGQAVFLDVDGKVLAAVEVGALPDMVTFTPDGQHVLVANEGEPSDDYLTDPEGSVSIIDLPTDIAQLSQAHVRTAGFHKYNDAELDASIRIFGPGASVAQDLEPEYITVSKNSKIAWVALQENNAIAVLDIEAGEFSAIHGLGFKDHLLPGNELDASNRDDAINITNWPVLGMYQPDAISSYEYRGRTYIVTANEGDARDYAGYSEESRFRALTGSTPICADAPRFQAFYADNAMGITNLGELRDNANLGRLNVTTANGLRTEEGCYEEIYSYGARSFSIWTESLDLVYDSGAEFEHITAARYPEVFNSSNSDTGFDSRSDDKGPEPEAVAIAKLWGRTYAFIGLERIGGVMVYDISNPHVPAFVQYINNRDFDVMPDSVAAGDLGPEGLKVITADKSPIPGVPLLAVASEVSGTTTLFRIERERLVGKKR